MQRTTEQTLDWYRSHETAGQIGFNPDGMCLKICRTARNIGSAFPSALSAQLATPSKYRVHDVRDVRPGMIGFYDDPNDSNPFGHIVTYTHRHRDENPSDLRSLTSRSNSVRSGLVLPVRSDFYPERWGDRFQFAAVWLNGVVLDMPEGPKPEPKNQLGPKAIDRMEHLIDVLTDMIQNHLDAGNDRLVTALRRDRRELRLTIRKFRERSR